MTLYKRTIAATFAGVLAFTACGGGSGDASGCPSFTMDFSDGPDTAAFREVRPDVEKGLETCPHVTIESYPSNDDQEQAEVSQNIASNFLTSIGTAETKTRVITEAPTSNLAGKVQIILSDTAPLG